MPASVNKSIPVTLTIAGSDSGAGAGIQADLKTFAACGVYGASAITAVTAQNTQGVNDAFPLPASVLSAQLAAVLEDMPVVAIKTGMLANDSLVAATVASLREHQLPLVVDPVMVSTSGDTLLDHSAIESVKNTLIPLASLITPNIHEAALLLGQPPAVDLAAATEQAERLLGLGCQAVLLTGGHLGGGEAVDVYCDSSGVELLRSPRLATQNTHGTGCTLSAAICAYLARGESLFGACTRAKGYVHGALAHSDTLTVGRGRGPLNHFYAFKEHL